MSQLKHRVLVLGGGGREHAIAWKVQQSPLCGELFVAPGNAGTPGTTCAVDATDPKAVIELARKIKTDLVIVGPETVIAAGVTDALVAAGFAVFGPSQAAGELETSKIAARLFCERHGIAVPTSRSFDATQVDEAIESTRQSMRCEQH
jgi:phosphoribosylamine---glycine ligase